MKKCIGKIIVPFVAMGICLSASAQDSPKDKAETTGTCSFTLLNNTSDTMIFKVRTINVNNPNNPDPNWVSSSTQVPATSSGKSGEGTISNVKCGVDVATQFLVVIPSTEGEGTKTMCYLPRMQYSSGSHVLAFPSQVWEPTSSTCRAFD